MARMHSRKKGKAKSTKPLKSNKAIWERYTEKEVSLLIEKLAKQGKTSSEIGIALRDAYGIPDVKLISKKSITTILKEKKIYPNLPEDVVALIKKLIKIMEHTETNKHDQPSIRGLTLTESKIKRLSKYYKKRGILPENWRFSKTNAKLLIE
ncbi:MAG: 30S ribosomal protein S15 [Nanoarchaeota archaeon]|nr:30S ribosomal protein S15 [Nanoarchaeota archaeon]|tara:strand:- start:2621 stop:3076 length:456 start_codon:yes stop_codon:yes gene_type:complete